MDRLSQSWVPRPAVPDAPAHLPRCRLPDAPLWRSPAREGFPDRPILRHLARRGVPVAFRASTWLHFTGAHDRARRAGSGYFSRCLAASMDPATAAAVGRDVDRTFPMQAWFATAAGRSALRDVLLAFAAHNDRVGYCQSLNFLAGTMLLACGGSCEDAFWLLVQLVEDVYPPDIFSPSMLDAFVDQRVVERLLRARNPTLMAHLDALHVPVGSAALEWLLCGFATSLPMETALRVWDAALVEGRHIMFRAAATLLDAAAPRLLACREPNTVHRTLHAIGAGLVDADWLVDRCMDGDAAVDRARARQAWAGLRVNAAHAGADSDGNACSDRFRPHSGAHSEPSSPAPRARAGAADDHSLGAAHRRPSGDSGYDGDHKDDEDEGDCVEASRHGSLLRGFSPRALPSSTGPASEPGAEGGVHSPRPDSPRSAAGSEGGAPSAAWFELPAAPRQWWARNKPKQRLQAPLRGLMRRLRGQGARWPPEFSLEGISRLRAEVYPAVVDEIAHVQAARAGASAGEA